MDSQTIDQGVNQSRKHSTIVTCMTASGERVIPYVVALQDLESRSKVVRKSGIEFAPDLTLKRSQNPDVNRKSFPEYVKSRLIHYVA
jgi:hypothetical protein